MLLTTQYLDEADQLADRISVVDHGRVIAEGTPDELKARVGGDRLECVVRDAGDARRGRGGSSPGSPGRARHRPRRAAGQRAGRRPDGGAGGPAAASSTAAGIEAEDVGVRRPTLDEAFLHLTGHADRAGPDRHDRARRCAA